jgi:Flp pilus assembly protein TadG
MADRKQSARSTSERGVVAVELAIILPLFGILLLGVMELGGIARDYQILQNAAREGAQFSARSANSPNGLTTGEIGAVQTTIKNRIIAYLANEKITVAPADIGVNQAYPITVGSITVISSQITITYDRPLVFPGISRWIPLSTSVQGRALFRNFY